MNDEKYHMPMVVLVDKFNEQVQCTGPRWGSPMSHDDLKKWQCRMFLALILPNVTCQFKNRLCHMSLKVLASVACH